MSAASVASSWIRPSPVFKDVKDLVCTTDGAKDTLEGAINIFEWMSYLGFHPKFSQRVADELNPIKQTLAFPSFVESLGKMRDRWHVYHHSDDPEALSKLSTSVAETALSFSESAMAVDAWGIYSLKENMQGIKTSYWSSLGFLDVMKFFQGVHRVSHLNKNLEVTVAAEPKNILEHRIQHTYLSVLKSVTSIAMAAISLTSLLFASLAQGLLFSPVVFLGLTSAWLILHFTTHFYGKMIDRWEAKAVGNL